jgi:hypothetical protein
MNASSRPNGTSKQLMNTTSPMVPLLRPVYDAGVKHTNLYAIGFTT